MMIPDFQHGLYKDVASGCRKLVTGLSRGKPWQEVTAAPTIDTSSVSDLIVLHGPSPLLGGGMYFHSFVLHSLTQSAFAKGKLNLETVDFIFDQSLESPWSLLGLLAQTNTIWIYPEKRHKPMLDACVRFWDDLIGAGSRYSNGSTTGAMLWDLHSNLKYVLSNLGVPTSVLNSPLPDGDIRSMLDYVKDKK